MAQTYSTNTRIVCNGKVRVQADHTYLNGVVVRWTFKDDEGQIIHEVTLESDAVEHIEGWIVDGSEEEE